jgi:L-seryl-tRNA(Ser) seleniumtransferase
MSNEIQNELRKLPAVEKVLSAPVLAAAIERYSHPVVTLAVRAASCQTVFVFSGNY